MEPRAEELLTIGRLSELSGVPTTTLRYYDQLGLLSPNTRVGGQRRYRAAAVDKLTVIGLCKRAGFTLDEIRFLYSDDSPGRARSRALAAKKLAEIEAQVMCLEEARAAIEWGLRCRCRRLDACTCGIHGQ